MDKLTPQDWGEIYYALIDKQYAVEAGNLGENAAEETPYANSSEWAAHLDSIIDKIGPDGENMYT